MANYNLTNQPISASFQQLLQKNDSNFLVDGTGSLVDELKVTGSISSSTYYGDGSNLTGISGGGGSTDTGSLLTTASFNNSTRDMTFTKGDASTFDVNIPAGSGGSTDTGSLLVTSSFNNSTRLQTFTKGDGSTYTNSIPLTTIDTGSFVITGSVTNATSTFTKGDGSTFGLTVNNVVNATSASHAELADLATLATNATNAVSASNAISSSKVTDPNIAYINKDNTFTGTQNFDNIAVSGTGSFGYLQSITGSAKIIGDAFIVLNADTPTQRYAGIKIEDTGSASTASFEWDGDNDKWITVDEGGNSSNILVGPEGTKGSEGTFFTNVLPKSLDGTGKLVNSTILDNGSGLGVKFFNYVSVGTANWQFLEVTGSGARKSVVGTGTLTATTDGTRIFNGSGFYGGYSTIYNSGDDHEFGIVGQSSNYSGDWEGCGIMNNADGGNSYTTVIGFQDKNTYTDNTVTILTPLVVSQSATFKEVSTFDNDINANGFTTFNSDVVLGGLTITTNDFNPRGPISSSNDIQAQNLTIKGDTFVNSISASSFISASTFVGDGSNLTGVAGGIFIETGSYYATSNDLQVSGSFSVSKAIGGQNKDLTISSNTASIDLRDSNTYTVQLVSSADTHIDVTQFGETAQSLNLLVKQPSSGNTGSISFSNDFKFGGGYEYQPTPLINSEDILSFTRFGSSLYGTFINNFS